MGWRDGFETLRVTAVMRCGVVADPYLPLDAVLLYQATRERFGVQALTRPGGERLKAGVRVPLQILPHRQAADWFYACSFAQAEWLAEGRDHWNKRFDTGLAALVDFQGRRGKVLVEQGEYRAYHHPVSYRVARAITWYCVGDRREITALLATATHLGKKTSQGWGRVMAWRVEPWPEDWSVWRGDQLMRAVPVEQAEGRGPVTVGHYGIRPSYYRTDHQRVVALPV